MSRAPRPIQTATSSNAVPAHVMSNMQLASSMGVPQVPSILVQSSGIANNDPTSASMTPLAYNTPMVETQHIPVVDFKAGVSPVVSVPAAPQPVFHTQVPTHNPYGVTTTPSVATGSSMPTSEYMQLSRQLSKMQKQISESNPKYSSPYNPKYESLYAARREPYDYGIRSHHRHHSHHGRRMDDEWMRDTKPYDSELRLRSEDDITSRLTSSLDRRGAGEYWR